MARNVDIRLRRSSVPGNVPTIEQLNLGELAINTADGKLFLKKIYDGGVEQVIEVGADARSGLVSTFNTYIYTSDGTLQDITGADDFGNYLSYDLASPRRIQVYLNGVLLHQGIDYTAADGTTISMTAPIDVGQVVQVAAYNSEGASIDADLILDDGFSFTVGTDEETKLYHNGSNTILKHYAYGDNTFNMMWRDSDRLVMGEDGIALYGNLTINGNTVVTDSDVVAIIGNTVDQTYVEALNLTAGAISYTPDSAGEGQHSLTATNVQAAIDMLHQEKLDISALSSNLVFYPTSVASEVSGYNHLVQSQDDSDYDTTAVNVSTGVISGDNNLVGQIVSDQGILVGSTGVINVHVIGNIRQVSGNSAATFYFQLFKIDENNSETFLTESSHTVPIDSEVYAQFYADALLESTTFTATDRLAVKFYADDDNGGSDATFEFQFGGTSPVRMNVPVALSVIPQEVRVAAEINVDTSDFDGILTGNDDTVQKALDTIDNMSTDELTEGTSNLYFTVARARNTLTAGGGILYSTSTGEISVDTTNIATVNYAESYTELYADSQDAITLASAIEYVDSAISNSIGQALIEIGLELDSDRTDLEASILNVENSVTSLDASLRVYIDSQDNYFLNISQNYADSAINTAINNLVDGAPDVLDTLNELAAALGDDSDFIGTVQNWINQKLDKTATTDDLAEGIVNEYHTTERVRNSLSAGNGLSYNPLTGTFDIDSDVSFDTVTAVTFNGDLNGNAATATNADNLDGQSGEYYRINVYDANGTLLN